MVEHWSFVLISNYADTQIVALWVSVYKYPSMSELLCVTDVPGMVVYY